MRIKMPIGIENFSELIEDGYYFVDKTRFIMQLIDYHSKAALLTRPRRFGKTLTLRMLEYFFSIKHSDKKYLFSGTDIEQAGDKYICEQGKYPVVFISLKEIRGNSFAASIASLAVYMKKLYTEFDYILKSDKLHKNDIEEFNKIYTMQEKNVLYGPVERSCGLLIRLLHQYHGVKPILLLDEYDAPIQKAWDSGYYDEMIEFMRGFMGNALKGNDSLNFSVITGVLRVAKESIFSDLNNIDVCSVLSNRYADVIGFTDNEIKKMTEYLGISDKFEEIKRWYNGYNFGGNEIYNPWSVLKYVVEGYKPAPYWVNTSANAILKELFTTIDETRLAQLNDLLNRKYIYTSIDEGVIYDDIGKNSSSLYTMLLTTGYLTVDENDDDTLQDHDEYRLCIPNEELIKCFSKEILSRLGEGVTEASMLKINRDMVEGKLESFQSGLQEYITNIASCYDTSKQPEVFYHGLMLGFVATLRSRYIIESNRESGKGRFDIALYPRNKEMAGVILEFKKSDKKGQLKDKAIEARQQIEENEYIAVFAERGIKKVWKYGIAFWRKSVFMAGGSEL